MLTQQNVIYKRTNPIKIKEIPSPKKVTEYSLKQNFFDPSKSSPPNEFMIKLHMRMNQFHRNDNSLDME